MVGERALPWLLIAVALFVRLYGIDLIPFDSEQVLMLSPALHFARTGQLPPVGGLLFRPGMHPPPLVNVFLAAPLKFSADPMWVGVYQCVIDALTVPLLYRTAGRLWNRRAGFAAAGLYAVLPAALMNARYVGNIGPVPFLCAAAMCGLSEFVISGEALFLGMAVLAAALAAQLHLTVGLLALPLLLVAACRWRKIDWRWVASGLGLALAPLIPYLRYQLENGWPDVGPAMRFLAAPKTTSLSALDMASSMLAGDVRGRVADVPLDPLGWALLVAIGFGAVVAVRRRGLAGWVPVLFVLLPVAAAIRHSETVAPYYLLAILPAGAALFGAAISQISAMPLAVGASLLVLAVRTVPWLSFVGQLAAGNIPPDYPVPQPAQYHGQLFPPRYSPPYNVPLRFSREAATVAQQLSSGGPVFVGPRAEHDWVMDFLTDGRFPFVGLSARHTTLLPSGGSLLLVDGTGQTMPWPVLQFASPLAGVSPSSDHTIYSLARLQNDWFDRFDAAIGLQRIDARFGGSIALAGNRLDALSAGRASRLALDWRPPDATVVDLERLHLFARLIDSGGKPWSADADVPLFEGTQWQPGSAILSQTEVTPAADTPAGGYWLELGLYGDDPGSRLPLTTAGAPPSTRLRLGPFRVSGPQQPAGAFQPRAIFGRGEMGLASVSVSGSDVRLVWTALAAPAADYTAFVHVLDSAGNLIAQSDGPPGGDSFPTSLWAPGDVVRDTRRIDGSLAAAARLEIGLYTQPQVRRLEVSDSRGARLGTAYEVALP